LDPLEKVYAELYYDRQLRKIIDGPGGKQDSAGAPPQGAKRMSKKKTRLILLYNALLVTAALYILLSLTLSWITSNIVTDTKSMRMHVYEASVPTYLNANFNSAEFDGYTNEEVRLRKRILPGDIIKLSVFIHLRDMPDVTAVNIEMGNVPAWVQYVPGSGELSCANKTGVSSEAGYQLELEKAPGATPVPTPERNGSELVFLLDVPEGCGEYDGLCLDFWIFFEDDETNQNQYMNQVIRLRFAATNATNGGVL